MALALALDASAAVDTANHFIRQPFRQRRIERVGADDAMIGGTGRSRGCVRGPD